MNRAAFNGPVVFFTTAVLLIGGLGMMYKMTEFANTIVKGEIAGFGAVALSVYAAGMLPLLFLSLWGVCRGHFHDIERPKYRMLELDALLDQEAPPQDRRI